MDAYPLCPQAENTKFFLTGVPNTERERVSFDLNQTCTCSEAISILVSAIGPLSDLTRPSPSAVIDVPSGMRVAVTYPRVNNVVRFEIPLPTPPHL